METLTNWAGNLTYGAAHLYQPETLEQLQEIVAASRRVKALGTRHAFNEIANTPGAMVSMARFDRVLELDRSLRTVTVEAGIRYGDLARYLQGEGFALHNLASLPHISVAGACATATHGSGVGNACLSAAVSSLEIVKASGEAAWLSRATDPGRFPGAVVGLGALGIVTKLTLAIEPTYNVRQDVYENLPFVQAEAYFDEIMSSGYSVSLFTRWQGPLIDQVWRKRRVETDAILDAASEWFGATLAARDRHPLPDMPSENCTIQRGIPGPWHERLPHFRLEFTPSSGEELQSEYLVPRPHAVDALRAIYEFRGEIAPLLHVTEIRTIMADDLWMSPFYRQDCVAIHFTWHKNWPAVQALLPRIEAALEPFDARPHWGKLFTMRPERLQTLYERLPDFRSLVAEFDPEGKFRNEFLDRLMIG